MAKEYRIGFCREPIKTNLPFTVNCINLLENDNIEMKSYNIYDFLRLNTISDGITMVETKIINYIIYDSCSNTHPLWLKTHPCFTFPMIYGQELNVDYSHNPPILTKKSSVNKKIESCKILSPGSIFVIKLPEGKVLFGI